MVAPGAKVSPTAHLGDYMGAEDASALRGGTALVWTCLSAGGISTCLTSMVG
jgi:hypothetical protein